MSTTINKKINHIFLLLKKLANGQELYAQDTLLHEELFGINESLKDAQKANERSLRRYLEDIYTLYQHIIITEKKTKEFSNKKVKIYKLSSKQDISIILKFFLEEKNDLAWIVQMLHDSDPSILKKLEKDVKKDIEKELKNDSNIFLFNSSPFEIFDTDSQKKDFTTLKNAVKNHEYRDIDYTYHKNILYKNAKCLKMIYTQNNWYVGIETEEEVFRLLRINFINSIKYSDSKNSYNKSIVTKYMKYFQRFENAMTLSTKEPTEVRLIVSSKISIYFEENMKKFYKSQKFIKKHEDGSIEFSILHTQPLEVLPFIKQWLPGMELVSPSYLKDILIEELKESLDKIDK